MALTTQQRLELSTALLSAFPRRADLKGLLWLRLGRNLDEFGDGGIKALVVEILQSADAEGWTRDLVNAAIAQNPGNELLEAFYNVSWIALDTPKRSALETIIRKGVDFLDVDPWLELLIQMSRRVCRIEVETQVDVGYGTGFLVGANVAITNYHVLAPAIAAALGKPGPQGRLADSNNVGLRFDYRKLPDGSLSEGTVYRLAATDWLLDWSPPSAADAMPIGAPAADELDYALVRLAASPADDVVPHLSDTSRTRGWIDLPPDAVPLAEGAPLSILQHPDADHLKLALESNAVVKVTPTRVQYRTNTLGGSSGSPCFTQKWELAALHHRGDPKYPDLAGPTNQGIPFAAIVSLMRSRGTDKHLGSSPPPSSAAS